MNTRSLILKLAGVSLVALAGGASALTACSGDNSNGNPAPTQNDSGSATDSTMMMGDDSSMGSDTSSSSSGGDSSSGGMDVVTIDTGGCISDAANCNSCYTASQAMTDPYNACSPYTVNCTPFKNSTRITGLSSDGGVPLVP
jgi:hypothetical protein